MARDTWLPWFIAAFFGCVITAELAYNAYTGAGHLITWRVPVFAALMLATPVSWRIAKLQFGMVTGLTLETHIAETRKEVEYLESLSTGGGINELEALLEGATGQRPGIWSQLIIYRLALRVLLVRLCRAKGIGVKTAESMVSMLNSLQQKSLIDPDFADKLHQIRDVTYFVEWPGGRRPSNEEIKQVLSQAPALLRRLVQLIEGK
jgi:hypothetical protein